MARKRTTKKPATSATPASRPAVTPERFGRLYRLVSFLSTGPRSRQELTTHLSLDVRGFYRDLEVLRAFGIEVALAEGQYRLAAGVDAVAMLPYPDPHLTLGEARQLARGKSAANRKLSEQIDGLTG